MADTTTRYAFPFQEDADLPDGPALGQNLAEAVEAALADVEDTSLAADTALDARLDVLETEPAWTAYTPVWSASSVNPTLGNGTITGAYRRKGSVVHIRIVLTLGSTSAAGTGVYSFTLPAGAKVNSLLTGIFQDASASSARTTLTCHIISNAATGSNMRIAIDGTANVLGASLPVVPANGDVVILAGTYEAD